MIYFRFSQDKALPYHGKSRTALQQKALVSKFLHYSLAETDDKEPKTKQAAKPNEVSITLPLLRTVMDIKELFIKSFYP